MSLPPRTLVESLQRAARESPGFGVTIVDGRGRNPERRSYPELLEAVRTMSARYRALGIRPGDRVLIGLPTSWEFLDSWLGAMFMGALPAALAPPGAMGSSEGYADRVRALFETLDASSLISTEMLRADLQDAGAMEVAGRLVTVDMLRATTPAGDDQPYDADPEETAFLQFTSGSTGQPRAVVIPHQAAVHNNRASDLAIGAPVGAPAGTWGKGVASWLPMHHDMGLVGSLFLSIYVGRDLHLLNPTTFLARPVLWLQALSAMGPTFSPAPNFGYQLCVERLKHEQLEGLDLSRWNSAMTGAEMIRPETMQAFTELTAGCGFRPEAVVPCYGLAEASLAVTFDVSGQGIRTRPVPEGAAEGFALSEVVSVGPPIIDTRIRICGPDGSAVEDGTVGEVRIQGPGVFSGYYNDPESTAESLKDGWLCTGDLGFVHDGELYLTGRVKDLLIVHGNNIMPHELEWLAESVAGGGGASRCGAFSVARGAEGEQVVLVVETAEKNDAAREELGRRIRIRIGRSMGLPLADVVLVRRGRIPKTTSGKVQRRQLRKMYLDRTLAASG